MLQMLGLFKYLRFRCHLPADIWSLPESYEEVARLINAIQNLLPQLYLLLMGRFEINKKLTHSCIPAKFDTD